MSYWLMANDDVLLVDGKWQSNLTVNVFHTEASTQFLVLSLECASLGFLLN